MIKPAHAHDFGTETNVVLRHLHRIQLFTYPANGTSTDGHTHRFQGVTDSSLHHFHRLYGNTGPAIVLRDGSHVHAIESVTDEEPFRFMEGYYETVTDFPRHSHRYGGSTGVPLGYEPEDW